MEARLSEALVYWKGKRGSRPMPARRDFDPVLEVPRLLPWIVLTDVIPSPPDFRFRLIGTGVAERLRRDYTRMRFSELPHLGPDSQLWRDRLEVAATREPKISLPPYVGRDHRVRRVSEIHLPLSDDGTNVDMIFSVLVFHAS